MTNTTNARFTTVEQAAQFLDEKVEGWAKKIDLKVFNIVSTSNCVLSQVFGNYVKAIIDLGIRGNETENTFFACSMYQNEWIEEIKTRLANPKTRQQELEDAIAAMQKELDELLNPMISVTLSKKQWIIALKAINRQHSYGASYVSDQIQEQIGEQV